MTGNNTESKAGTITSLITSIAASAAEILTVKGVMNLAKKLNKEEMLPMGKVICIILCVVFVISLVTDVASIAGVVSNVMGYASLVGAVAGCVGFIMTIIYLGKAKKMLAEN